MEKETKKYTWLKIIIIVTLILISIILYSRFIATKGLDVKEYKITNELIGDNFYGFKIAHISDIHYGKTVKQKELENLVNEVNLLKPDVVILTGDLIDKDTEMNETTNKEISDILSKINVTIGAYAIDGNHDKYFSEWQTIIEDSGFKNLNNTYELIYSDGYTPLLIAGLSSSSEDNLPIKEKYLPIEEYLNSDDSFNNIYKILLMHEPDFLDDINYQYFNLVLAGHTHFGQVRLPLIGGLVFPAYGQRYKNEYYKLNNADLYISSGVGTSTISFRLFNKPSINFYRLTNK